MAQSVEKHEGATFGDELAGRELEDVVFTECDLRGADLREIRTRGCRFDRCTFVNADLSGSIHEGTAVLNSDLRGATLSTTTWRGCKLTGSDLTDARMLAITIVEGDWSYVNLRHQALRGVDLTGVRLIGADLSEADLVDAVLAGADLTQAILRRAVLDRADLRGACIDGVDLSDVSLTGTHLDLRTAVALAEQRGAIVDTAG